jgi:hypothetical protein
LFPALTGTAAPDTRHGYQIFRAKTEGYIKVVLQP